VIVRQNLSGTAGAHFSDCERYRYLLWRVWRKRNSIRWLNMLMLNGSKATHEVSDPTVDRQVRRAQLLGFDGLYVTNIFAWMSTDPKALYTLPDPVGPDNDRYLLETATKSAMVICGWGNHGVLHGRGKAVYRFLSASGISLLALRVSSGGEPWHPLYLPYNLQPTQYERS
jgi:hypothetical protein